MNKNLFLVSFYNSNEGIFNQRKNLKNSMITGSKKFNKLLESLLELPGERKINQRKSQEEKSLMNKTTKSLKWRNKRTRKNSSLFPMVHAFAISNWIIRIVRIDSKKKIGKNQNFTNLFHQNPKITFFENRKKRR